MQNQILSVEHILFYIVMFYIKDNGSETRSTGNMQVSMQALPTM